MDMQKTYNPNEFEKQIYQNWEKNGYFKAKVNPDKVPFTVVIPPPNITGQLHIGHALDETLQDTIVRFKRMQGYETLWLPGTDHASIATEVKIVELMKKEEGLTKEQVGREGFMQRAWAWKEKYGGRIVEQLKCLGSSCDWSRLAFTMDEKCSRAVKEVFVNLYNKGLIYQGSKIINWCPSCKTALSDAEVEYEEEASNFWHLDYPLKDGSGVLTVATTRPETMLGDTAVAVNPKDKRFKSFIGKTLILPIVGREIPVVADDYVALDFGTGAVKITPAHDPNDFEVGLRHNLEVIRVMNDDGTMNENAGKYQGLDRFECRRRIVEDLKELGVLSKIEPHAHNVGHCYRCHSSVEPIVSKQWFVKMDTLAKPAIAAVKNKSIKFIPERFTKIYYNWMENIKDWCISRQLWWGHRIPVYYCEDCGEMMVLKEAPVKCTKCGSTHFHQDPDVLDTWFSSALWPFSTLGYPEMTEDLKYFYPTDVLVTGYDIIFFWVARMIFSGLEHMARIPFKDVVIHGLVRDDKGRKMSKSLGNGVDPIQVIDEYGADTLRFSLVSGVAAGSDIRFSKEKCESSRNFINKVWNASRFVLMNAENVEVLPIADINPELKDKWILSKLNSCIREVTVNMNKYELGVALTTLHDFVWYDFCDWYIELCKSALYGNDQSKKQKTVSVLIYVLNQTLKLLHPFIPFVTEEIYSYLPNNDGSIMVSEYPRYNARRNYKKDLEKMNSVMDIIKAVRQIKSKTGASPSKKVDLFVITENKKLLADCGDLIKKLSGVETINVITAKEELTEKVVTQVLNGFELYIPLGELVDIKAEIERLTKELEKTQEEIDRAQSKLNNTGFINKAPKDLVENERKKLEKYVELKQKINENLKDYLN